MRPTAAAIATALRPRLRHRHRKSLHAVRARSHFCAKLLPAQRDFSRRFECCASSGGGGNRTRVRGRTGQSVYKRRLPLSFTRRPVGSRPTAGLVILWCRTSGDDVPSVPSPFVDAASRTTGRARSDALRYWLGSESECRVVFRTCIDPGCFTRPTGDLGLQLCRRTDHVET